MAAPLKQLLEERHLSARGLSLACGLAGDTVRNLLSGRAHSPRGEVAQALADQLGVTVNQLYGREPLPQPMSVPERALLEGADHISEIAYRSSKSDPPHVAEELAIEIVASWVMPGGFLAAQGLEPTDLVFLRAPHDGQGFRRGDRLLVDKRSNTGTPPGTYILFDGRGLRVAKCHVARSGKGSVLRVEREPGIADEFIVDEEIDILGRVVGRWEWM